MPLLNEIISNPHLLSLIELTITGYGNLEKKIIEKIIPYQNIKFKGFSDKFALRRLFHESSFFINSTLLDPYSRVLSEASSAGLFIISSIYDDSINLLENGANFFEYDPKEFGQFEKAFHNSVEVCHRKGLSKIKISNSCPFSTDKYADKILYALLKWFFL